MAAGGSHPGGDGRDEWDDDARIDPGWDEASFEADLARLAHWAGESQVAEAVEQRRRSAWLARQAQGDTDMAGVLAALAERRQGVVAGLANGARCAGQVAVLGRDVAGVDTATGRSWLAVGAVAWLRVTDGDAVAAPHPTRRSADPALDLTGVLADLAADRARLSVSTTRDREWLVGRAMAVGRDVLTVRPDAGGLIYVALASVAEVSEPESG